MGEVERAICQCSAPIAHFVHVEFEIGRLVADLLKITTPDEPDSPKAGRGKGLWSSALS
jgi:hypothetical protein